MQSRPSANYFTASYAVGYVLPPLTGLRNGRAQGEGFISELLTQDTSFLARFSLDMVDHTVVSDVSFETHHPTRSPGISERTTRHSIHNGNDWTRRRQEKT